MVIIRLGIRLRFTKVPGVQGERVFRDTMTVADPYDHSYQDISDIVEKKLRFMDAPPCDFTVFHTDNKTGDTLVVDDAYFSELLKGLMEEAFATGIELHKECVSAEKNKKNDIETAVDNDSENPIVNKAISFDVEVIRERPIENGLRDGQAATIIPLTSEALQAHNTNGDVNISIAALTCPPKYPNFFIRGVVIAIRFNIPKPNVSVCAIDICDVSDPRQQITLLTFDATVQKAVKENLRGDRKQVVELRNVYIRLKSDVDKRFQTNTHPFIVRMDRMSRIEVVKILPVPLALRSEQVVTVRNNLPSSGLVDLSDLAAFCDANKNNNTHLGSAQTKPSSTSTSSSSSSMHSGARRTMFSLSAAGTATTFAGMPVSGVVPSKLGEHIKKQQEQFFSKRMREDTVYWEPDTTYVTAKDVRMRDAIMQQQVIQEENRKERIRQRREVSQVCIICGVNCDDTSTLSVVINMLKNNNRNMGRHLPSMEEVRHALSDRRRDKDGKFRNRLVCSEHFVDLRTNTLHVAHCRCVHLCTSYQRGAELEDVVFCELPMQTCDLCGMSGASVCCYHPDCREKYHTLCALFSCGYVNFGKKDPYLPCPACPKHTQVVLSKASAEPVIEQQGTAFWWEEDDVVFDSRVVEETDLRDPDENDGA